jgi:hypothetical protein
MNLKALFRKHKRNKATWKASGTVENYIKMNVRQIRCVDLDCIVLALEMAQRRAVVNT